MDKYERKTSVYKREPRERGRGPQPPNGMALASMMCGMGGIVALCGCMSFPFSMILGAAAVALAITSRQGMPFSGHAIAGLVCGIISLVLSFGTFIYLVVINSLLRDPAWVPFFDEAFRQYQEIFGTP